MPLSWSVCSVCSPRPSLPKHQPAEGRTPDRPAPPAPVRSPGHVWSLSRSDQAGDLRGAGAMGQHALDQLADVATQRYQGFQASGMTDGWARCTRSTRCREEQIAFGHHPDQAPSLHQADVGDMSSVIARPHRRRWHAAAGGRALGHQLADRLVQFAFHRRPSGGAGRAG